MLATIVPQSLKDKLRMLNALNQAFVSDKLEFIPLMLDFKIAEMTSSEDFGMKRLLEAYTKFKEAHPVFISLKQKEGPHKHQVSDFELFLSEGKRGVSNEG